MTQEYPRVQGMIRGYIEAIRKIEKQLQQSASNLEFDDIVVDRCLLYGAIESHQ